MQDYSSKLSLFISIDLVGSTSYKNAVERNQPEQPWLELFESFYADTIFILRKHIGAEKPYCPKIWKTAGDEILFFSDITNEDQIRKIIVGLHRTIIEYHKNLSKRKLPLKIKGTAWLAGFPVINTEIIMPETGGKVDYIGPSIDAGFRLTKFADSRNLIISVELAYILSETLQPPEATELGGIFFENEEVLKGAFKGLPYPILSIKILDDYERSRLSVLDYRHCELEKLKKFCLEFINHVNDPFIIVIPYINREDCPKYNAVHEKHEKIIIGLQEKERGDYEKGKKPDSISDTGLETLEISEEIRRKGKSV